MAMVLGMKRRKERCPTCQAWLHLVRLGKRYRRTMFCPKCNWIGLSSQADTQGIDAVELVKQHGVEPTGKVKRYRQVDLYPGTE